MAHDVTQTHRKYNTADEEKNLLGYITSEQGTGEKHVGEKSKLTFCTETQVALHPVLELSHAKISIKTSISAKPPMGIALIS